VSNLTVHQTTRALLLSAVIASHADRAETVRQFRNEVLGGALLEWEHMELWILQERTKEQGHAQTINAGQRSGQRAILEYGTPTSSWIQRVPIASEGVLAHLSTLSSKLARDYQWQRADATIFILTGLIPIIEPLEVQSQLSAFKDNRIEGGMITALSRIVFTVDPLVSPRELLTHFQAVRQSILGHKWRDLRDRQLALAQFALDCSDNVPWLERMDAWNQRYPEEWSYARVVNFRRDCKRAVKKLLAPFSVIRFMKAFLPEREVSHAETPCES
jgi:hypothetical protein